jgi:thiopurine S-methyltransferase
VDSAFWLERWASNQIGFHEPHAHPMLEAHWPALGLTAQTRVLVPLCGKSLDMVWLAAHGHDLIGIELASKAVLDFFAERALTAQRARAGAFERYSADRYSLLCGDFFALDATALGPFTAIYDRAALIALPPVMRSAYADRLTYLAAPRTRMLLITVDYDEQASKPPPFIVREAEVDALYARSWQIERLASVAAEVKGQPATEIVYRLTRG